MEPLFCAESVETKHPDFTMAYTHVKAARYVIHFHKLHLCMKFAKIDRSFDVLHSHRNLNEIVIIIAIKD